MNTPTLDKAAYLALLKKALDASLTARTEHDLRKEKVASQRRIVGHRPDFEFWTVGELLSTPNEKLRLDGLIQDPVRYALRKQIRSLGKELYRLLGSTDAMRDVLEEVSAEDFQYRANIIDKAWDGIGDWYA